MAALRAVIDDRRDLSQPVGPGGAGAPAASHRAFILVGESARVHALVVDDEQKLVALIRRGLVEEGYAVDVALTGEDALELLSAMRYDIVVLDIALPGINGFDVCRRLRESDVSTPILMLTALDGAEDRMAGFASGANEYLTKPFSFVDLLGHLRSLTSTASAD